jgi:hypothetical protein
LDEKHENSKEVLKYQPTRRDIKCCEYSVYEKEDNDKS